MINKKCAKREPVGLLKSYLVRYKLLMKLARQNIRTLLACKCLVEDYKHKLKSINLGDTAPVGWFTYPFLEHIAGCDMSKLRIFEWGGGNSTIMWAYRCKEVITVESDDIWIDFLKKNTANFKNIKFFLAKDYDSYTKCIVNYINNIDIILIDGRWRYECAAMVLQDISKDVLIILDNSEWCPETNELFQSHGYARIDFPGFGPSNQFTWCTSIFFKSMKSPLLHPVKLPSCIGGISHDECGYMFFGEHK